MQNAGGRKPAEAVRNVCSGVTVDRVRGCCLPERVTTFMFPSRFSGHSILVMLSLNEAMRPGTEPLGLNVPTVLLSRNGAVDQRLASDGGRV